MVTAALNKKAEVQLANPGPGDRLGNKQDVENVLQYMSDLAAAVKGCRRRQVLRRCNERG